MIALADPAPDYASRSVTPAEFKLFQDLIHREAGIYLGEVKKALLVGRLSGRLRELRLGSFGEYHRYVTRVDPRERIRMLDCITTNETRFFRENTQFEHLEQRIIPKYKADALGGLRPRRVRVWSAACSSGEEPYSLAMTLLSHFPRESGWTIEILASDISTRVLDKAREGVWAAERVTDIPERFMKRFMIRSVQDDEAKVKAGPEIKSVVRFERLNLNDETYKVSGKFDLIFCRNVLIYFNAQSKERVIQQLLRHMEADGRLFLGHAESILGLAGVVQRVGPTIYGFGERS